MENKEKINRIREIILEIFPGNVIFDVDASLLTSIRTGGQCMCLINVKNRKDLHKIIKILLDNEIVFHVIGDCTNILFNDGYIDVVLIKLCGDFDYVNLESSGSISAGSACNVQKFVVQAAKYDQDFSFMAGIPGSIGGAVIGSSGTKDSSLNSFIKKIRYLAAKDNKVIEKTLELDNANYGYRYFNIPDLIVLTDIVLKGNLLDKSIVLEKVRENIRNKKLAQPFNTKNLGCFFKNPPNCTLSAGEMIERCNLKNFFYGNARVSDKHANFIENYENARSGEVYILSKIIKDFVRSKFNKELDYEIELIGF
ncbi:MAG: FAD-binding protein [Actinobacteria bacterium]|nr:FAD-binding protein [Actinomycetota bacterium]